MGKKQFYQYLDNDREPLEEVDDLELAAILKECETLDTPDPGTDYWNNFNANLQSKLDALPAKKPFWLRFQLPIWSAVTAAIIVAVFLYRPNDATPPPGLQVTQDTTLDLRTQDATLLGALDNDTLDILLELYQNDEEEEESFEMAENDYDIFYQVFDSEPGQSMDELIEEEISAEDLKALWDMEG